MSFSRYEKSVSSLSYFSFDSAGKCNCVTFTFRRRFIQNPIYCIEGMHSIITCIPWESNWWPWRCLWNALLVKLVFFLGCFKIYTGLNILSTSLCLV